MRVHYVHGNSTYRVYVSPREVRAFNAKWPCSALKGWRGYRFDFSAANGDLIAHDVPERHDGAHAVALAQDAQRCACDRLSFWHAQARA